MKGKVIVTSGATREPIDSVRFISNFSSGRTGAAICEALAARGFQVIQVAGVESTPATGVARDVTAPMTVPDSRRPAVKSWSSRCRSKTTGCRPATLASAGRNHVASESAFTASGTEMGRPGAASAPNAASASCSSRAS